MEAAHVPFSVLAVPIPPPLALAGPGSFFARRNVQHRYPGNGGASGRKPSGSFMTVIELS